MPGAASARLRRRLVRVLGQLGARKCVAAAGLCRAVWGPRCGGALPASGLYCRLARFGGTIGAGKCIAAGGFCGCWIEAPICRLRLRTAALRRRRDRDAVRLDGDAVRRDRESARPGPWCCASTSGPRCCAPSGGVATDPPSRRATPASQNERAVTFTGRLLVTMITFVAGRGDTRTTPVVRRKMLPERMSRRTADCSPAERASRASACVAGVGASRGSAGVGQRRGCRRCVGCVAGVDCVGCLADKSAASRASEMRQSCGREMG